LNTANSTTNTTNTMCPKVNSVKSNKNHPSVHPVDRIWLRLRRPFRYPRAGHACSWERYDADRAGCTLCGQLHRCSGSMVGCECPLADSDEGGHVCLITGLCISEVRASCCEFVSHVSYEQPQEPSSTSEVDGMHDRVLSVVKSFLNSPSTIACRRQEQHKSSLRIKQVIWRVLRQKKREHPYRLPCLCSVVAEVAHAEQMQQFQGKSLVEVGCIMNRVVHTCAANIAAGMLQIHRLGFRKICQGGKFQSMVVGMLYMSRTGLHVGNLFRLPAVHDVHELLPSETYLNSLGISNKVICDTENELKSCIRAFTDATNENNGNSNSIITKSTSHSNNCRKRALTSPSFSSSVC
jgi:hypothetical protein